MRLFVSSIAVVALAASTASAGVVGNDVSTTVTMGNAAGTESVGLGSGLAPLSTGPFDIGADLGNSLGNATVRGDYVASPAGVGPNGGTLYTVGVRVGSRTIGGQGAIFNPDPVIAAGNTMPSTDLINTVTLSFGLGGGGVAFDDFGAATQILIDNDFGSGVVLNGFPAGLNPFDSVHPGPQLGYLINGDGTLGLSISFDADFMRSSGGFDPLLGGDFAGGDAFGGSRTGFGVNGFVSTVRVEVIPEPASALLLTIGGLALLRRRR